MARNLREEWTLLSDLSQGHSGAERRTARTQSGGDGGGGPPLPIPNRAVKPASADGTARKGGRVGYRRCSRGSDRRAMSSDAAPLFLARMPLPFFFVRAGASAAPPRRSSLRSSRLWRDSGMTHQGSVSLWHSSPAKSSSQWDTIIRVLFLR